VNTNATANIFDMFETDTTLEKDGVVLEYGTNSKGQPMFIKVARAGGANVQFQKVYEHITKPYRRQIDTGNKLPKELNDRLNRELYARAVVKAMGGFEERDGTPIPTSTVEEIMDLFQRLPNLFADVMVQASGMSLFRDEVREGAAGN
jgi:hypothetical protein